MFFPHALSDLGHTLKTSSFLVLHAISLVSYYFAECAKVRVPQAASLASISHKSRIHQNKHRWVACCLLAQQFFFLSLDAKKQLKALWRAVMMPACYLTITLSTTFIKFFLTVPGSCTCSLALLFSN